MYLPISYDFPLFRPPSEANSVIIQATIGCSWNKCTFCEMYKTKHFRLRNESELIAEINSLNGLFAQPVKIFIADGDAMVLSTSKLLRIASALHNAIPRISRISVYALPSNIQSKSDSELKELYDAGYKLIYVGIESGNDALLNLVNKGETYESNVEGLLKARKAGIKSSVMILTGLGGKSYSTQHATDSACLLNEIQPEYASTLVLSFPYGLAHFQRQFGAYISMNNIELLDELKTFISHLNLSATIFRSDHASNYLPLKGVLNKDKDKLINLLNDAIQHPDRYRLREEWERGL